ncbi:hypothetical protein TeGR_g6881 [Tetraparma gracilis]|uniref:PPIase cyclophilin-type domain-containing protein n=1 Tax=Tetraparma gracilis TaxID=2962635 RepID=A0ABQ6MAU8_9STRA|nr:hypothetical protein TeGR_g6881 [Tetraparma gracilis]
MLLQFSLPSVPDIPLGACPPGSAAPGGGCPEHDPGCGCHGPVMRQGMLAWAGGVAGSPPGAPAHCFIYTGAGPAKWWRNEHTVFGEVAEGWDVVEELEKLETRAAGGVRKLIRPVAGELLQSAGAAV